LKPEDDLTWTILYDLYELLALAERQIGRSPQEILETTRVAATLAARPGADPFQQRTCAIAVARLEREIGQRPPR